MWHLVASHFKHLETCEEIRLIKIEYLPQKTQNILEKEAYYYNFVIALDTFLSLVAGLLMVIPQPHDAKLCYYIEWLEELFPKYGSYLVALGRLNLLLFVYIEMTACCQTIYLTKQINYQQQLILCYITRMQSNNFSLDLKTIKFNSHFQEKVRHQLIMCWKKYSFLYR